MVHGLFVPWTIRTIDGLFVLWTVRTVNCSYPSGLFVPWTVRTVPGRFVPCWERQYILYSVSQKKSPPEVFWHFFQNGWEFSVQILQAYCTFTPTVDYKFLFNCIQFWRTYTILSATTQRAFRPMVDISSIWWWSRLIWHNFVKVADN